MTGAAVPLVLVWLSGCAAGNLSGLRAQGLDSATSGCLRSPGLLHPDAGRGDGAAVGVARGEHVSVEPRYQREPGTGVWSRLDPAQVAEWLLLGMKGRLWGSLAPDVVLHEPGNPNKVQRVYDLKFPCPDDNAPSWSLYSPGQAHHPKDQGQMYKEALLGGKGVPRRVSPLGIY